MRLRDGTKANFTRPALLPALIAAAALAFFAGFTTDAPFYYLRLGVTVLALITIVFAWHAKNWPAMIALAVIVVLWNPIVSVPIPAAIWVIMQLAASAAFVALGILIRVPEQDG
jgi:hypothetical protein